MTDPTFYASLRCIWKHWRRWRENNVVLIFTIGQRRFDRSKVDMVRNHNLHTYSRNSFFIKQGSCSVWIAALLPMCAGAPLFQNIFHTQVGILKYKEWHFTASNGMWWSAAQQRNTPSGQFINLKCFDPLERAWRSTPCTRSCCADDSLDTSHQHSQI